MTVNIRNIDADLWRRLRAVAVVRQVPLGELVNQLIREYLAAQPTS